MKKSLVRLVLISLIGCGPNEELVHVEKPNVVDSLVVNGEFGGWKVEANTMIRLKEVVEDSLGYYYASEEKGYLGPLDYVLETTGEDGGKYKITLGFDHKKILVSEME